MISFTYFSVFVFCLAFVAGVEEVEQNGTTPAPPVEDIARRELTDTGYMIRNGAELYRYPMIIEPLIRQERPLERNPVETNQIQTSEENEEEYRRRPLFYFTYEAPENPRPLNNLSSRPYFEIRKKRAVEGAEVEESSKIGKLRRKRTYCGKCGGGGRGYYIPVTYAVYPVYYGGGGGKGCNTCGGGYGGGGGGGSFSYSSSSAQSSSGSFGWGKK